MKKCMEYRVEGRRPVGRPRKTWLESVEADMAELEIDKEDVHDIKKWRRNVMKRKTNPIGKRTTLKVMQWKAEGLMREKTELEHRMNKENIDILWCCNTALAIDTNITLV